MQTFKTASVRLCWLLLAATCALAQTSTSEISGTVRDNSGAVVPNASITLTNEQTGVSYRQQTTASGLFSFPALPVGSYSVNVEATGFKTARLTKNELVVNTPLTINIALEVGVLRRTAIRALCGARDYAKPVRSSDVVAGISVMRDSA